MRLNTQPAVLNSHHNFGKLLEVIRSQGGKADFSSPFQNLSLESLSSVAFEPVVKQNAGGKEAEYIMTVRKQSTS